VAWSSALQKYFVHPMVKRIFHERQEKVAKILPAVLGRIVPVSEPFTPQS